MRIPVKKSIFWIIYHRQEQLFVAMLCWFAAISMAVLSYKNMKSTPAAIVLFVAAIYSLYGAGVNSWRLFKEWRNV